MMGPLGVQLDPLALALPCVILLAACVALLRWALSGDKCSEVKPSPKQEVAIKQYHDLDPPEEPHVELAMDPPRGLHFSNPEKPYGFESERCTGSYMLFHPPPAASGNQRCQGLKFAEYFKGKPRLWEMRIQLQFKEAVLPEEDLHFGIELETYVPLNPWARQFAKGALEVVRRIIGPVYHSVGDDPSEAHDDEIERPTCVLPLWAFDQFVETPEGEEPPSIADPNFENLGSHRSGRGFSAWQKEVDELKTRLRPGCTYTFAFWGNSVYLDVLNWNIVGIPMAPPMDFDRFAGRPPVHVAMYSLMKPGDGEDNRHVQSRKRYCWRAALWTSTRRPERKRFEELIGAEPGKSPLVHVHDIECQPATGLQRQISSFIDETIESFSGFCTARPR